MIVGTLTTGQILGIFTEEIQNRQGWVSDTIHDGRRLFVRSLLPSVADVRPKVRMQGGVALRADHTGFGLMNAVTSLARDTRDPDDRWRLEELGGGIGAAILPRQPHDSPAHEASARRPAPV
jgi:hypothetical protein